ncbi:universal stress protein [Anaeromyxobacter sp. Fw109-5]|uniref:universal stress protein n=1 Tax=Anaeromyxobacter sp. (strain Fw109-5) TaxID=404589 RepID=UPI0000ED7F94|nr:universal stress protein [Anaeromyxobacter sp. Fw109-5]ABS25238.1 UspA domain protein [Anaeromyxobacter sp. Fw109-5]
MNWIVGIDLRPLSHGALQFAAWLAANAGAGGADRFVPVHVLEEEHLRTMLRYHHLDEVIDAAREEAKRTLLREGRAEWLGDLQIVQAVNAERSLEFVRAAAGAEAMVIGRAAAREGHRIVRLGRVARRLLRNLPSPVVVVPPDLRLGDVGPGPIVALTSLADDALEASRFASALARHTGRKLALVHVVGDPAGRGLPFMPSASLERARLDEVRYGEPELAAWVAAAGLRPDTTTVLQGNVIDEAIAFAERERSPLIVAGARRRTGVDRMLLPSIGRELAATSPLAVAVVPASA